MSNRMTVHMNQSPIYDIVMEDSFGKLPEELKKFDLSNRRICIVSDTNVAPLYLDEVENLVRPCCRQVISYIFPAGEEHKTLDTVRKLYETLILAKFDRNDYLLALGGGVVGDLCGFAAATYLRGISFIQLPTTLLSQVDSSIGGKTGVDFDSYKNMVGAFHMPKLVYENTRTLLTLTDEQFSAGMGEVIKHGLIKDEKYYRWILENRQAIWERKLDVLEELVLVSNRIKRAVVEDDPKEQGQRAHLNFGHTLGHAIEKLMDFKMLHGHCVAVGALASAYISCRRGMLSMAEVEEYKSAMQAFHIPTSVAGLHKEEILAATKNDKKMDSGVIKFILLRRIGEAYTDRTVSDSEMEEALDYIMA